MRVVLDLIDLSTRSIYESIPIDVEDLDAFAEKLDIDMDLFRHGGASYELESADLDWIHATFGLDIERHNIAVDLRLPSKLDELPYEVHTNRELRLMLKGAKPLSVFSDVYPTQIDYRIMPEDVFEPHVASGLICKREYIELRTPPPPSPYRGVRYLLYALAQHEWRIDAYIDMWHSFEKGGWSETLERRQGQLLGYSEWEIDEHLKNTGRWWEKDVR
jgi:hypothetical protein